MKKLYEKPTIEIIEFDVLESIATQSGGPDMLPCNLNE